MKGKVRAAVGILLSIFLLWWTLRDVSAAEVAARIRGADLIDFTIAIIIALSSFWIRAFRWGILLRPVADAVPFRPRLAATFIGFALNNLLPARVGEFARAFTLARLTSIPAATAFSTLVVERLLDGIIIVVLLFAVMAMPGFPSIEVIGDVDVRSAALVMAGGMLGVGVLLTIAVLSPRTAGRGARLATALLPGRLREPVLRLLRTFAQGLGVLRSPRLFVLSVALTTFQWTFVALSFLYAFRAFHIEQVPFSGAVFLQSLLSLAVAIPSSPGFFGLFEWAATGGLRLWDVPVEQAVSFAFGFHLGGFIPVTLLGLYYIWRLNLSWSAVSHSDEVVSRDVEPHSATSSTILKPSDA